MLNGWVEEEPIFVECNVPANFQIIWEGKFKENAIYYFLVAADNRNVGEPVSEINDLLPIAPYLPLFFNLTSYPTGEIIVSFNHEE